MASGERETEREQHWHCYSDDVKTKTVPHELSAPHILTRVTGSTADLTRDGGNDVKSGDDADGGRDFYACNCSSLLALTGTLQTLVTVTDNQMH